LEVNGKALIEYHLEGLKRAGINQVVINTGWLGEQIPQRLGDGGRYDLEIRYSAEPQQPLETAGGIVQALPLLGDHPFLVVNGDLYTDYPFEQLTDERGSLVHLVLVENPLHHPVGDFTLQQGKVTGYGGGEGQLTYSGMARFDPRFFEGVEEGRLPLAPLLYHAVNRGEASGEYYRGIWSDVGTAERLAQLQQ
jgi:MurNAc alpha-1-phosphate uridylyltransferase